MNFLEAEKIDGVRLSWNVWPTSRLEQVKLVIPLGVMYTPLMNQQEVYRCDYAPLKCRKEPCSAILSPWRYLYTATSPSLTHVMIHPSSAKWTG